MITLQDAVDDLYRIVVLEKKGRSPNRLAMLADMCIEKLSERGIVGARREISVPGIGRSKKWDVAWPHEGRPRLGISLKSLLHNIGGTVPNRIDDLMGEMANVQLQSPEIVTGYVVLFDTTASGLRSDGSRWVDFFRASVERLSGRDAPAWAAGMVEASAIVEVDFKTDSRVVNEPDMKAFFDRLADCVRQRNPEMFKAVGGEYLEEHDLLASNSNRLPKTTQPGFRNPNDQVVIRKTDLPGNDHNQYIYVLECGRCKRQYGANGSDIWQRRCPCCGGGRPGLPFN